MNMEEIIETKEPRYYTVRVYLQDQSYGGPEEGGWYYQTGEFAWEFVRYSRRFATRKMAALYAGLVNKETLAGVNEGRPSTGSVLSRGKYVAEVWGEEAPLSYPAKKPHYE
jgi:hypothetical protein